MRKLQSIKKLKTARVHFIFTLVAKLNKAFFLALFNLLRFNSTILASYFSILGPEISGWNLFFLEFDT